MNNHVIKVLTTLGLMGVVVMVGGCQNVGDWLASRQQTTQEEPGNTQTGGGGGVEIVIPPTTTEKQEIKYNNIFFLSTKYDPEVKNCGAVYWVHISGDATVDPLQRNISLLLAGPTEQWQRAGYFSAIPAGTKLNHSKFQEGVVYVDLSSELNRLAGSCAVTAARSQITATARAAVEEQSGQKVDRVVISVNGDSATALQP